MKHYIPGRYAGARVVVVNSHFQALYFFAGQELKLPLVPAVCSTFPVIDEGYPFIVQVIAKDHEPPGILRFFRACSQFLLPGIYLQGKGTGFSPGNISHPLFQILVSRLFIQPPLQGQRPAYF